MAFNSFSIITHLLQDVSVIVKIQAPSSTQHGTLNSKEHISYTLIKFNNLKYKLKCHILR